MTTSNTGLNYQALAMRGYVASTPTFTFFGFFAA